MKSILSAGVVSFVMTLLLAGCANTPRASFYTLNTSAVEPGPAGSSLSVGLGPIDIPDYLDRPQIVTRGGDNRLGVDEFNRWGGPLEQEISRVLAAHLGRRLGNFRVYSYPSRIAADTDYRIALELRRFDGRIDGEVRLDVAWSLIDDRSAEVLLTRQAAYSESLQGEGYAAYAAALSRLLASLGDELAEALLARDSPDKR